MIRVVRVITRLNVGGPAQHALLASTRLDPSRYETVLVCGRIGRDEATLQDVRPIAGARPLVIHSLCREISPIDDIIALIQLIRLLRKVRPHIVHTHLAKAGFLGRIAARIVGTPVVVHTFHGNVLRGYFGRWRSESLVLVERLLARLSTRIIAVSPRQRAELVELGIAPSEKIVEIPLGLELEAFLNARVGRFREDLGLATSVRVVTIVARLVPIKAVDLFIEAAALIAARANEVEFLIVGDGEERGRLEEQAARLGISAKVRFLGWREDLPAIYAATDVVVLTSHNEGTPVSVIEALAAGKAIVATNVGGVPDLLGASERGVLVAEGDVAAIATAVADLLEDPIRRSELGERGRRDVYPRFDASRLAQDLDRLYVEALDQRGERP